MIRLKFKSESAMEEEVGWLRKSKDSWETTTQFGEQLKVNPNTLEIEEAHGYESFMGHLLLEGKVRFIRPQSAAAPVKKD